MISHHGKSGERSGYPAPLKGKHLGDLSAVRAAKVSVVCGKTEVIVMEGFKKHRIPWSRVASMEVDGAQALERRITATRLVTLGVFALAAQKKKRWARRF
jgi:hypothetical protein